MDLETFRELVRNTVRLYERVNGHAAIRTWELITHHSEVGALSHLMNNADLQQGFEVLRDAGQLDQTFESLIVNNTEFFEPEIVEVAQWRLNHPYDLLGNNFR